MPTNHVLPESTELLQEIADSLWKAKKVLVVTGAGISTNSGIPDFRSKNGLYSLIQAQFEAAAAYKDEDEPEDEGNEPASKRQKLFEEDDHATGQQTPATNVKEAPTTATRSSRRRDRDSQDAPNSQEDTIHCASRDPLDDDGSIVVHLPAIDPKRFAEALLTPQRRNRTSLPASGDSIECLGPLPQSSSPLSSPPPILFDPSEEFRSGSTTSARSSSSNSSIVASTCSSSDVESDAEEAEETPSSSQPTLSSQSSFTSSRSTLPVMKGRDLFDASIWADPVKTSVFYTFATTLRQKVREVVPTRSHEFISHLRDTNKLVRCYTQNIDEIEEKVGLSTSLVLGPGKKGRFSARSASRASLGSVAAGKDESSQSSQSTKDDGKDQESQDPASSQESQSSEDTKAAQTQTQTGTKKSAANRDPCFRGVECVFLHGSLRLLRCFRCGQTTPWDEAGRENETMSGRQPSCPRCAGATAAREGRGKRALAIGKLRPDIVLYGEEHPNAHLISPIVQHDISLAPEMLLILGTSLKVHGLKVLVREFSKAVHSRGGKVVFVNFTKPPESVWSDVIDYWVQWDCDAWVQDLKEKKPIMWLPPGSFIEEPKKKRKSTSAATTKGNKRNSEWAKARETGQGEGSEEINEGKTKKRLPKEKKENKENKEKPEKGNPPTKTQTTDAPAATAAETGEKKHPPGHAPNPDAEQPAAVLDDQTNGAFTVWKIVQIVQKRAQISGQPEDAMPTKQALTAPAKKRPRHSAPAEMERILTARLQPDTLAGTTTEQLPKPSTPAKQSLVPLPTFRFVEPIVSRIELLQKTVGAPTLTAKPLADVPANVTPSPAAPPSGPDKYSILSAVKANPRKRQSKKIFEGGAVMANAQPTTPKQQQQQQQQRKQAKVKGRSKSMGNPPSLPGLEEPATGPVAHTKLPDTAWSGTDRLAKRLMKELSASQPPPGEPVKMETPAEAAPAPATAPAPPAPTTAPARPASSFGSSPPCTSSLYAPPQPKVGVPAPPMHAAAEDCTSPPTAVSPLTVSPASIRLPSSTTVLPPIRKLFPDLRPRWSTDNAFFLQDPLGGQYGFPPPWPQEWSCTDQLKREADERLKAAMGVHGRYSDH